MNFGGFAGGFAHGFNNGITIGKSVKDAMKEHKLQQIREQGVAEAEQARAAEIDKLVKSNAVVDAPAVSDAPVTEAQPVQTGVVAPASEGITPPRPLDASVTPSAVGGGITPAAASATATPSISPAAATPAAPANAPVATPELTAAQSTASTPPTPAAPELPQMPFSVGARGFKTREDAAKFAEAKVPSVSDYVTRSVAPKLQEFYVANGELDKAEQLGTYIESKRGKEAVKSFGTAMQKLMFTNDVDGGVKALGEYYNKFIDDGVDFTGGKIGEDGRVNITVKNRDSGKESVMPMTKAELVRLGMAHDPTQLFKMGLAQVEKQEAAQAEIAKESRGEARDIRKEGRGEARDIAKDKRTQNAKIEEKTLDAELDAAKPGETGKKIRDLRKSLSWSDERISHYIDKDGEFKKTTNPTERRALVASDLMKNDMSFPRDKPEVKEEKVKSMMELIYGKAPTATPSSAAPATPAAGGLSKSSGKGKGVPWYNPQTKQIEYR